MHLLEAVQYAMKLTIILSSFVSHPIELLKGAAIQYASR